MKITIITVVLNCANTIECTMRSVLSQTHKDIEYIIVDGNSSDNTLKIVREWEPKFEGKMRIFSEPDTGVYNAINKGISAATGDVIGLLHADDFYSNETVLESVAQGLSYKWVDVVYGDSHFVDSKDIAKTIRLYSARKFTPDKLRYGFAPSHPTLYCRRNLFDRYGLYKENYIVAADFEMFVRLFRHSSVLSKYLAIDMVTMRIGGLSTQWKHRLTTNIIEKRRALRENNLKISLFSLFRKYYYILNQ